MNCQCTDLYLARQCSAAIGCYGYCFVNDAPIHCTDNQTEAQRGMYPSHPLVELGLESGWLKDQTPGQ